MRVEETGVSVRMNFAGPNLCGGQQRPRAYRGGEGRADAHAGGGRTEGCRPAHLRQQAGSAERDECGGDHGQTGAALVEEPQLVHPGDMRD